MIARWFVDVSPIDALTLKERYCVEASHWQAALGQVRAQRQEEGPLSRFVIEVTDTGYRAIDPGMRLRYAITAAPAETSPEPPEVAAIVGRGLPPTMPGVRLLHQRAEDPTASVPIVYREYGYAVAPWSTPQELHEVLDELFERVTRGLADRPQGKYVQIGLFDHPFVEGPESPPVATLVWKDWRGGPVVRTQAEEPLAFGAGDSIAPRAGDVARTNSRSPHMRPSVETTPELAAQSGAESPIQTLVRSEVKGSPRPPSGPASEGGHPGSDGDLVTDLFERMGTLHATTDWRDGVDHLVAILEEFIPCQGLLVHVFDPIRDAFIVVRALGPHRHRALLLRTPPSDELLARALRSETVIHVEGESKLPPATRERWLELGVHPTQMLTGAVRRSLRSTTAIELANPRANESFSADERNALAYLCDQLADYVDQRSLVIDDALVSPER
jgi:hypothetical protein